MSRSKLNSKLSLRSIFPPFSREIKTEYEISMSLFYCKFTSIEIYTKHLYLYISTLYIISKNSYEFDKTTPLFDPIQISTKVERILTLRSFRKERCLSSLDLSISFMN